MNLVNARLRSEIKALWDEEKSIRTRFNPRSNFNFQTDRNPTRGRHHWTYFDRLTASSMLHKIDSTSEGIEKFINYRTGRVAHSVIGFAIFRKSHFMNFHANESLPSSPSCFDFFFFDLLSSLIAIIGAEERERFDSRSKYIRVQIAANCFIITRRSLSTSWKLAAACRDEKWNYRCRRWGT